MRRRKRSYRKWRNHTDDARVVALIEFGGFSARGIAEIVYGVPARANGPEAVNARAAVSRIAADFGISSRHWRNCETETAAGVAYRTAKLPNPRKKRRRSA